MIKQIAILDSNNTVVNVVISESIPDNGIEYSENNPAFIGGDYFDGYFYPPKPFASWQRNKGNWESPVPVPSDGKKYTWNEANINWEEVVE